MAERVALIQCTVSKSASLDENPQFRRTPQHGECRQKGATRTRQADHRGPQRAERLKAREETIAARNHRIAEREAARRRAQEREAAELAARQAAEAAAREAERQAREEAQARRFAEQTKREAAEAAEREAILAARRAGEEKEKATVGDKLGRADARLSACAGSINPMLCFGPPDPPFHPAWQRMLAFLLGSDNTHDAIDIVLRAPFGTSVWRNRIAV